MGDAARDDLRDVAEYYRRSNEANRARVHQLEIAVTRRLFAKYLPTPRRVLELGAGPGTYTVGFAAQGHDVTAVELVPELANELRGALALAGQQAKVIAADARDFVKHARGPFDAVVVMGPLYHLTSEPERAALMAEVRGVLAPKALVLTSHLTRIGLLGYMLARFPAWPLDTPGDVHEVMVKGHLASHPRNGDFRGYFSTVDEVRALHEGQGLGVVAVHSQDPVIGAVDELFNRLPEDLQTAWADALAQVSADPQALGSGRSLLCVSRGV